MKLSNNFQTHSFETLHALDLVISGSCNKDLIPGCFGVDDE